jgi:hypothetical protein
VRSDEPGQGQAIDGFLQEAIERPDLTSDLVFCGTYENQHRRGVDAVTPAQLSMQFEEIE